MALNVIIVGGGKEGTYLASLLFSRGYGVKVIEVRREEISRLQQALSPGAIILGSGTDPGVLEDAGIRQADVVAAVTGADEVNLVVTSLARFEFLVPRTIARVNNPRNVWMFTAEMGVDVALNQADLMAPIIAEEMSLGEMMTLLTLGKGHYSLVEERVHPTAMAAGKAIRDLNLPEECILVGVIREGELLIPHGNTVLQPNDMVIALANVSRMALLAAMLGARTVSEKESETGMR
ncbi:MAG: NAD-binding protein [Methanomicrobiales archaeon]|nr:NAD-binding protein [Methanomicrobiales archaeon]